MKDNKEFDKCLLTLWILYKSKEVYLYLFF